MTQTMTIQTDTHVSPMTGSPAGAHPSLRIKRSTERPRAAALVFYSLGRIAYPTATPVDVLLSEVRGACEGEHFAHDAIKSLPRAWREL